RDHHDGGSHRPSEPRQSAGEPDKEFRVLEPARALSQWAVASFVLGAVGDVVPDEPAAVYRLLVDADHAITRLLEEGHDLVPAHRVIPVFGLGRALHPDADIGLGDRSALVGKLDIRRHFGWVDAKYVTGGAVQPDMAEVAGLVHGLLVVEEQAYAVGRVILLRLDFLVRAEGDIGIGIAEQRNELFGHAAGELAAVLLLELHRVGEPAHGVAERADRKLD